MTGTVTSTRRTALRTAGVAAVILLWQFWQQIFIGLLLALAIFLLLQKIRELRE